jgi:hypothetical protein
MASKLTRLIYKIAIQLHLVAENCTICSSRSRRPVRKLWLQLRISALTHRSGSLRRARHWSLSWARCAQSYPRLFVTYRNKLFFLQWGVFSPSPNPQAGVPPFVGCLRLLIQYIHSCPPYLEAVSSIRNPRTRHAVVIRTQIRRCIQKFPYCPPGARTANGTVLCH